MHRYLLSDEVTAQRFSAPGLHAAIADSVADLASPIGLLFKSLLPRDPTGELLHIIDQLSPTAGPETRDGVWVSPAGTRALGVAQTSASGSDSGRARTGGSRHPRPHSRPPWPRNPRRKARRRHLAGLYCLARLS